MIRVLVADDHAVIRCGITQILEEALDITVTGEASTGREVLQAVRKHHYDVLVLDIAMPGGGGFEVLEQLDTLKPGLKILMLSMYSESHYAIRALRAGASGYLTKDSAPSQLIAAIRQVAAGGTYVTQSLAEKLAVEVRGEAHKEPHEILSTREYQVLCLLASGKTVTQIAKELYLSVKTISTYRVRLQEKLGLDNTAQLMRYAIDRGIAG